MAKPVEIEILLRDRVSAGLELMQRKLEGLMAKAQGSGERVRILEAAIGALTTQLAAMRKAGEAAGSSIDQGKNIEAVNAIETKVKELQEQLRQLGETAENTSAAPAGAGQAARQYNGLHMSVQQIARELPAATMGLNMFFLAISNNIPILTDEIKRAKAANEELKASGQGTVPVWRQLVSSIFSWQTALMVGVTVLSMYGKEIASWIGGLGKGGGAAITAAEATGHLSAAVKESSGAYGENMALLKQLSKEWGELSSHKERQEWIEANKDEFHRLGIEIDGVSDAENAFVNNTRAVVEAMQARAKAEAAKGLASEKYAEALQKEAEIDAKEKERDERLKNVRETGPGTAQYATAGAMAQGRVSNREITEHRYASAISDLEAERKAAEATADAYFKLAEAYGEEEAAKLDAAGVKRHVKGAAETGGSASDAPGKATRDANAVTAAQAKVDELTGKQARERAEREAEIEAEVAQARIDALADGAEKARRQRELDNKKELDAIERQRQAYIEKETQAQREVFEAEEDLKAKRDPSYRKRAFDSGSVSVDTGAFDELSALTQKRQAGDAIKAQEAAWREYLLKYGDYQQRRQAIAEKYGEAIEASETAGDAAMLQKEMQEELDALDEEMRGSVTLLGQLFADASEKSVGEIQKIIDKAGQLMAYLGAEKDAEGTATIDGEKVTRGDILDLGISENTLENLERSPEEVEALRKGIARLKGEIGSRSPFKQLEEDIKAASAAIRQGKVAEGVEKIGAAVAAFAPALGEAGQSLGTILGSDELGAKVAGVADALGGLGATAAGVAQMMSGDVAGGAMAAVNGIASVVSALDGLFGADYSEYYALKEQYDQLSEIWDELIAKKKEYIDIDYGAEAQKAGAEALELLREQDEYARRLAQSAADAGSSIGSHSIAYRQNRDLGGYLGELRTYMGADNQGEALTQTLIAASADELREVREGMFQMWMGLDGDFRSALEERIAVLEEQEAVVENMKEAATGTTFDAFYSGYVDMLQDMDTDNQDLAENFEKYLEKSILSSLVADKYRGELRQLYDTYAEMAADGIDADEAEELRTWQERLSDKMLADRDMLADTFGWEGGSGQTGKAGAYTAMSQEQGTKLEGLWTTSAMHLSSMDGTLTEVSAQMGAAADCLRQIEANTGSSAKHLGEIKEDIKKIVRDGLKVK